MAVYVVKLLFEGGCRPYREGGRPPLFASFRSITTAWLTSGHALEPNASTASSNPLGPTRKPPFGRSTSWGTLSDAMKRCESMVAAMWWFACENGGNKSRSCQTLADTESAQPARPYDISVPLQTHTDHGARGKRERKRQGQQHQRQHQTRTKRRLATRTPTDFARPATLGKATQAIAKRDCICAAIVAAMQGRFPCPSVSALAAKRVSSRMAVCVCGSPQTLLRGRIVLSRVPLRGCPSLLVRVSMAATVGSQLGAAPSL